MTRLFWIYLIAGYLVGCIDATPHDMLIGLVAMMLICLMFLGVAIVYRKEGTRNTRVMQVSGRQGLSLLPRPGLKNNQIN